jgi:Undecaprenyl-phosphate glucose phosphotransferase
MSSRSPLLPRLREQTVAELIDGPTSRSVPRLVDFHLGDKSTLISPSVLTGALRGIEFLALATAGLIMAALYVPGPDIFESAQYVLALAGTSLIAVIVNEILGLYRVPAIGNAMRALPRVLIGWSAALGLLVTGVFFLKIGPEFSRVWLLLWLLAGGAALIAVRVTASVVTRRWMRQGRLNRRAVVFGSLADCETVLQALEADGDSDIRICGVFDEQPAEGSRQMIAGYPRLGALDDLIAFARRTRLDMIILALPMAAEGRLLELLKQLWVLPVDIRLAGTASRIRLHPRAYSYIGNVPLLDLADRPITGWGQVAKSVLDKLVAALALVLLAPVMMAVAVAIRLDSRGPILFRQKRYGFNNELIEVFKFRSMYVDQCDDAASRLVTRGDRRVTPIGRFIRRTSLDELPQLFNVLRGELSLVGPRPHAVQAKAADKLYDEAVESYFARHRVKPGITGWAQVNGWRGETDTEEKIRKRVEHDLYYIENWSLLLDLYILVRTPLSLLKTEQAY